MYWLLDVFLHHLKSMVFKFDSPKSFFETTAICTLFVKYVESLVEAFFKPWNENIFMLTIELNKVSRIRFDQEKLIKSLKNLKLVETWFEVLSTFVISFAHFTSHVISLFIFFLFQFYWFSLIRILRVNKKKCYKYKIWYKILHIIF